MKSLSKVFALICVAMLLLTACGGGATATQPPAATQPPTMEATEAPATEAPATEGPASISGTPPSSAIANPAGMLPGRPCPTPWPP